MKLDFFLLRNVTDFVAILASNLRMFLGHENPFENRIPGYTFSQGIGHCK